MNDAREAADRAAKEIARLKAEIDEAATKKPDLDIDNDVMLFLGEVSAIGDLIVGAITNKHHKLFDETLMHIGDNLDKRARALQKRLMK